MKLRMADVTRGDYKTFNQMHLAFRYAEINPNLEMERKPVIKDYEDYYIYAGNEWIYFAMKDGDEIGYVVMTAYDDMSVKLEEVFICKKYQQKGNGKKFVKKIVEFLKDNGMKKVEVFSATMATDAFWAACNFRSVNGSEMFEYEIK